MVNLDKFFDFLSNDHRKLLVPFILSFPIVYTLLSFYIDGYLNYSILAQCMFASATIMIGMAFFIVTTMEAIPGITYLFGANSFLVFACFTLLIYVMCWLAGYILTIEKVFIGLGVVWFYGWLVRAFKLNKTKGKGGELTTKNEEASNDAESAAKGEE